MKLQSYHKYQKMLELFIITRLLVITVITYNLTRYREYVRYVLIMGVSIPA